MSDPRSTKDPRLDWASSNADDPLGNETDDVPFSQQRQINSSVFDASIDKPTSGPVPIEQRFSTTIELTLGARV